MRCTTTSSSTRHSPSRTTTVFGGLIWLLVAAAVAGEAAARDVATGMHPLTYTAPVSKAEYLGGRFLAAFVLNALILLAVQAGILLAVYSPGVDAEVDRSVPAGGLSHGLRLHRAAERLRRDGDPVLAGGAERPAMAGYLGSVLLVFMGFFVASFLLFRRGLGTLLDPIGIRFIVEDLAHLWTTIEKSTRLLGLEGALLTNRLLWIGIALAALAVTYLRFRFAHRTESTLVEAHARRARHAHSRTARRLPAPAARASAPISVPQVPRTFGFAIHARQTLAIAWDVVPDDRDELGRTRPAGRPSRC